MRKPCARGREIDVGGLVSTWQNRITGSGEEDPTQLLAHPNNWRVHPQVQREALSAVMRDVGWVQQVIVNQRTGHLIDGHLRVDEAMRNDEPMVPVVYVDLAPEEESEVLLTLDPLAGMAHAAKESMDALLRDVSTGEEAVQSMLADLAAEHGLDYGATDDPEVPEPQIDRAEELREQWGVERGQVWEVGRHRVMCGDATSEDDVALLMDGDVASLMVTDPPYGVGYEGKTKDALTIENDDLDEEELASLIGAAFDLAEKSACRAGAYWYATVPPGPLHLVFAHDWKRRGILRQILVWAKDSMVLGDRKSVV